jgi:hypothetical protein
MFVLHIDVYDVSVAIAIRAPNVSLVGGVHCQSCHFGVLMLHP